ncbi:TPA: hypothetical protein OPJ27_004563 [Escherichia coli]|nr:hypothetical protein [Escherichia coli]HCR8899141.1 hypothetical protein [Escherichia coli]
MGDFTLMATNNFKAFALDPNANVTSQADWEALPALLSGFTAGKASSAQVNKAIRQASFIAAALAQYTANKSGLDVLDDGDLNGFISKMGTAFGKDFQALDATLSALAGLATGANKLPYFTGNDTAALTDLTSVGRDIIGKSTIVDILTYLGLVTNGNVGRLINIQKFTSSGVYTPTPGTKSIKVKAVGGGGAGGGAVATSTGVSAGGGGGSGAYAEGYYTSGFSGLTVTIGAAGASASGAVGGNGGTTSFGALISCPGGGGGQIATASNTTIVYSSQGAPGGTPTGSGLIVSGKGQPGQNGVAIGTEGIGIGGIGSPSPFGGGGTQSVNGDNGASATSYGSGGGGTCNAPSQSAHSGGAGAPGVVIVEEYA